MVFVKSWKGMEKLQIGWICSLIQQPIHAPYFLAQKAIGCCCCDTNESPQLSWRTD